MFIIGMGVTVGVSEGRSVGDGGGVDVGDGRGVSVGTDVGIGVSASGNSGVLLAWGGSVAGEGITTQAMAINTLKIMIMIRIGFFMSSPPHGVIAKISCTLSEYSLDV